MIARLAVALAQSQGALRRTVAARHRLQLRQARHDARLSKRDWQVKRRERTRHLIALGGLIVKADLVVLTDDDRAVILGVLIEAAGKLRSDDGAQALALWRRRGQRAFAESETSDPS